MAKGRKARGRANPDRTSACGRRRVLLTNNTFDCRILDSVVTRPLLSKPPLPESRGRRLIWREAEIAYGTSSDGSAD